MVDMGQGKGKFSYPKAWVGFTGETYHSGVSKMSICPLTLQHPIEGNSGERHCCVSGESSFLLSYSVNVRKQPSQWGGHKLTALDQKCGFKCQSFTLLSREHRWEAGGTCGPS